MTISEDGEANSICLSPDLSKETVLLYNKKLFDKPIDQMHEVAVGVETALRAKKQMTISEQSVLDQFGNRVWYLSESTGDFVYSVHLYNLQRTMIQLQNRIVTTPMKQNLRKMNDLYAASFGDGDDVWKSFLVAEEPNEECEYICCCNNKRHEN